MLSKKMNRAERRRQSRLDKKQNRKMKMINRINDGSDECYGQHDIFTCETCEEMMMKDIAFQHSFPKAMHTVSNPFRPSSQIREYLGLETMYLSKHHGPTISKEHIEMLLEKYIHLFESKAS